VIFSRRQESVSVIRQAQSCVRAGWTHPSGWLLGAALFLCAVVPDVFAVEVIAYPGQATATLSRNAVRALFGMRQTKWPDGTPVKVFVLSKTSPAHETFCKEALDLFPYQLHQSWDRLVYSGTGQAPIEVGSEQEMRERVLAVPGAIGYVTKLDSGEVLHAISIR